MKKTSACFALLLVFLTSCRPTQAEAVVAPTASPLPTISVTSTPVITRTPVTTPTQLLETASPTRPSPNIREAQLTDIRMMDKTSGWGWAVDRADEGYLLRTSDGGLTWEAVSPGGSAKDSFFLDGQTAWVLFSDHRLAQTSDAGKTWKVLHQNLMEEMNWPYPDWIRIRFVDAQHGWLRGDITAAGARVLFYETQDGGVTWQPADFETLPSPYRHENARNEIAFWINTDVIYYDLERFILAPGDQEATLEMFLSNDWGNSWKTIQLPSSLPDQPFNPYDRKIHSPVFFDARHGALAVTIWDGYANATQLSIYGTSDGGLTWSRLGGPATLADTIVEPGSEVLFLSLRDAVLRCGTNLCVTHDSGKHWQTFDFGISMPTGTEYTVSRLDFSDPYTGWFLLNTYDEQFVWHPRLFRTKDGGATWEEISPVINP